jgi:predicted dehydrogenase
MNSDRTMTTADQICEFLDGDAMSLAKAIAALSAGSAVLISVDAITSHDEWSALDAASKQTGASCCLANRDRYRPSSRLIYEQLKSQRLGEPGLIRLHAWSGTADFREHQRMKLRAIDVVLWLFGERPEIVQVSRCSLDRTNFTHNLGERTETDNAGCACYELIHMGFSGGRSAVLDISHAPSLQAGYWALHVIGSRGAAYADDETNVQLKLASGGVVGTWSDEMPTAWNDCRRSFQRGLLQGNLFRETLDDWRQVLEWASAGECASAEERHE